MAYKWIIYVCFESENRNALTKSKSQKPNPKSKPKLEKYMVESGQGVSMTKQESVHSTNSNLQMLSKQVRK